MNKNILKHDVAATFVGNLIAAVLFMCCAVILARKLGPANRGLLSLAMLIPYIASSFCILGQDMVNMTFAGLYRDRRSSLLQQSLIITVLGGIVSVLIIYGFYYWLPVSKGKFGQLEFDLVMWSCLITPIIILSRMLLALLRGVGKIKIAAIIHTLHIVVLLVLLFVFLVLKDYGLKTALIIMTLYPLVIVILSCWMLRDYITLKPSGFSRHFFKKSLGFGGLFSLAVFAGFVTYRVGHGILGYMVSLEQVGQYAVAVGVAEQLRLLPSSISVAFLPNLANDMAMRQSQVPVIFRYTMIISFASMLLAAIAGAPAMLLFFGWKYAGAVPAFLLILPGIASLGAASILASDLAAREKPKYSVWVGYLTLGANVIFSFVLIPLMGISGAALASSIAFIAAGILWLIFYKRESGILFRELMPRIEDFRYLLNSILAMVHKVFMLGVTKFKSMRVTCITKK